MNSFIATFFLRYSASRTAEGYTTILPGYNCPLSLLCKKYFMRTMDGIGEWSFSQRIQKGSYSTGQLPFLGISERQLVSIVEVVYAYQIICVTYKKTCLQFCSLTLVRRFFPFKLLIFSLVTVLVSPTSFCMFLLLFTSYLVLSSCAIIFIIFALLYIITLLPLLILMVSCPTLQFPFFIDKQYS